jgi:hypothetical protein
MSSSVQDLRVALARVRLTRQRVTELVSSRRATLDEHDRLGGR